MNSLLIIGYASACFAGAMCITCVGIKLYFEYQNMKKLTIAEQLEKHSEYEKI